MMRLPYSMSKLNYLEDIYVDDHTITFYPNAWLGDRQHFTWHRHRHGHTGLRGSFFLIS